MLFVTIRSRSLLRHSPGERPQVTCLRTCIDPMSYLLVSNVSSHSSKRSQRHLQHQPDGTRKVPPRKSSRPHGSGSEQPPRPRPKPRGNRQETNVLTESKHRRVRTAPAGVLQDRARKDRDPEPQGRRRVPIRYTANRATATCLFHQ